MDENNIFDMELDNFSDEYTDEAQASDDASSATSTNKAQEPQSSKNQSSQEASNKEADDKNTAKQTALEKEVSELREYVAQQKAKDAFANDVQSLSKEYRDFDISKVMDKIKSYDVKKQEEIWRKGKDGLELVYLKEFKKAGTNNSFDSAKSLAVDNVEELSDKVANGTASLREQRAFWSAAAEL